MKRINDGPLVGAHMSIAGGIHRAFDQGERAGCRTIQIFLKNNTQWRTKPLTGEDALLFRLAREKSAIQPVVAHSCYLINAGSPDAALSQKSLSALTQELQRAAFLEIPFLIMHPGAHMGAGEEAGICRVADTLNRVLDLVEPPVGILLENTAGQGTALGHSFEQLASILDRIHQSARVGVCLDTCHLFAAGYDIRTEEGYRQTIRDFDRLIGIEKIRAFHVNDCKRELGSRIDRHTHIGKGFIGIQGFRPLINDRRFSQIPKILETPKGKDLREDRMNLRTLRRLVAQD
jgi:deoxyribonuclease-4